LVQGCAGLIPSHEDLTPPRVEESFQVRKGRPGIVIGVPQGTLDENTGVIAADLATLTGFSLVVVTGAAHLDSDGRAPRESVAPLSAQLDHETRADDAYRRRVAEAAQGPLRLYVEVYGDGPSGGAGRVEIRTIGFSRDDAWRLLTLFELIRDSRLEEPSVPRLEVRVESLDGVHSPASAAWQGRMPAKASRALAIDLPRAARTTYREAYTKVLGTFLSESVTVLMQKDR